MLSVMRSVSRLSRRGSRSFSGRAGTAASTHDVDEGVEELDGPIGSLISRVPDTEWLAEVNRFDQSSTLTKKTTSNKPSFRQFVPSSALEWNRTHDREAGDDESHLVRRADQELVHDTKLLKAKTASGWNAVKTAGPDALIDMIQANASSNDPELWSCILGRIEYLSTTVSVKKIRLILEALAGVNGPLPIDEDVLRGTVHALGQEMLCRFHSLTLLSCSSVAESMAKLRCRDEGTLNILALAFKQNLEDPTRVAVLTDAQIVDMACGILDAYARLKYVLPTVLDTVLSAIMARLPVVSVSQRIGIIQHCLECGNLDWLQSDGKRLLGVYAALMSGASVGECLQLVDIAPRVGDAHLFSDLARLLHERVRVNADGTASMRELRGVDAHGLPIFIHIPIPSSKVESMKNCLDADSPLRVQLDRIQQN